MTNDMWIVNLQMVTSKYVEEFPFKLYEELSLQKFWWNILCQKGQQLLQKWSEWVSDCCLMPFQQYYGENKFIFNEMMMKSALY